MVPPTSRFPRSPYGQGVLDPVSRAHAGSSYVIDANTAPFASVAARPRTPTRRRTRSSRTTPPPQTLKLSGRPSPPATAMSHLADQAPRPKTSIKHIAPRPAPVPVTSDHIAPRPTLQGPSRTSAPASRHDMAFRHPRGSTPPLFNYTHTSSNSLKFSAQPNRALFC